MVDKEVVVVKANGDQARKSPWKPPVQPFCELNLKNIINNSPNKGFLSSATENMSNNKNCTSLWQQKTFAHACHQQIFLK